MIHHLVLLTTKPEVIPAKLEDIMVETRIRLLKIAEVNNLRVGKRVDTANNPVDDQPDQVVQIGSETSVSLGGFDEGITSSVTLEGASAIDAGVECPDGANIVRP